MPATTVIRGVTLIDGTGAEPIPDATIVIEDERIATAGRAAEVVVPEGADVVDGASLWAVPGLIDTHVHIELVGREALPVFLALGLTTVRDLGGALELLLGARRELADGAPGPRLLFSGPMIDGVPPTWPTLVRSTSDADAAVRVVEEYLEADVDAIKLYTMLSPDALRRCIERVDGRVPVTGHLARTLASEAMEAGINGLEHALLTPFNDFVSDELRTGPEEIMLSPGFWGKLLVGWLQADFDSPASHRWFDLLRERDVSFCPTLTVMPGAGDEPLDEELQYTPTVAERWLEATLQRQQIPTPPEVRERARAVRGKLQELVLHAHQSGGRVVVGTDTGAIRSLVPGFATHHEMAFLAEAGLSNMEVLCAATGRAAEALRRDDLGTIAPGKRADVLLLRRDPLQDMSALRDIQRIYQDGRAYDPAALLAGSRSR